MKDRKRRSEVCTFEVRSLVNEYENVFILFYSFLFLFLFCFSFLPPVVSLLLLAPYYSRKREKERERLLVNMDV